MKTIFAAGLFIVGAATIGVIGRRQPRSPAILQIS
jgi:hypothetical protein